MEHGKYALVSAEVLGYSQTTDVVTGQAYTVFELRVVRGVWVNALHGMGGGLEGDGSGVGGVGGVGGAAAGNGGGGSKGGDSGSVGGGGGGGSRFIPDVTSTPFTVFRRYSEFHELFHRHLTHALPGTPFPARSMLSGISRMLGRSSVGSVNLDKRKGGLAAFITAACSESRVMSEVHQRALLGFLTNSLGRDALKRLSVASVRTDSAASDGGQSVVLQCVQEERDEEEEEEDEEEEALALSTACNSARV
jgi:hypothetical protein